MKEYYEVRMNGNRTYIKVSSIQVLIVPSPLSSANQASVIMGGNVNIHLNIKDAEELSKLISRLETKE
jgi:hypothetical protein